MNLRTPGPTPLPPRVREALARDMVDHRGPEFAAAFAACTAALKRLFRTEHDVLILTGSGSGGLEAAVVNLFSPGERVLSVSIGSFGRRFAQTAAAFGVDVAKLEFAAGEAADPSAVTEALAADPAIRAVLLTHNETSTGVTNDLPALARVVREAGRLVVVDSVSAVGAIPLEMDAWGCDVVITGSQKSWMIPPGLTMIGVGPRGWEAQAKARLPRMYWDWARARASAEKHQTPWTPAVGLIFALETALDLIEAEGLDKVHARHRRVGERARAGVRELGLRLVARDAARASDTVTAFWLPKGVAAGELRRRLRDEHAVVLAGGQDDLAGKILRIGHLGHVDVPDVDEALAALRAVLAASGPVPASAPARQAGTA
ncbi:MAG: alanine--glyoxylate aminotransferase family protein [Chloroflexota bacterium]|nr:alanine--glyoxylate aminotransferase family protein [Chloroflexota bacterium]